MRMQQIRYFLVLCDELNFRGAAKRSGVSQPTLTSSIAALERKLGGALFERKPHVALTPLGRELLPHLQSIAERADRVMEIAQTGGGGLNDPSTGAQGKIAPARPLGQHGGPASAAERKENADPRFLSA